MIRRSGTEEQPNKGAPPEQSKTDCSKLLQGQTIYYTLLDNFQNQGRKGRRLVLGSFTGSGFADDRAKKIESNGSIPKGRVFLVRKIKKLEEGGIGGRRVGIKNNLKVGERVTGYRGPGGSRLNWGIKKKGKLKCRLFG